MYSLLALVLFFLILAAFVIGIVTIIVIDTVIVVEFLLDEQHASQDGLRKE